MVGVERQILSKFSQLSFCQKLFFLNQTPSCICSMCLHCIGKVSNCSIKSCGRSWLAHEGTIYAYTKAFLGKYCLSAHSCHFVKNYFFWTKLVHAYVQCVFIVSAKYLIVPLKAVVGVDQPMKALNKRTIREKLSKFSYLSFCQKLFFSEPNSFMHMFNVSTLYRQIIKLLHQKLW